MIKCLATTSELKNHRFEEIVRQVDEVATLSCVLKKTIYSRVWEYPWIWLQLESLQNRGLRILDIGSEKSPFPFFLAVKGFDVIVSDVDTNRLRMWKRASHELGVSVEKDILDAQNLNIPTASLDIYQSVSVIEHVPNKSQVIAEAARVLRPGGLLIMTFDICESDMGMTFPKQNGEALSMQEFDRIFQNSPWFETGVSELPWNTKDIPDYLAWHRTTEPWHNYATGGVVVRRNKQPWIEPAWKNYLRMCKRSLNTFYFVKIGYLRYLLTKINTIAKSLLRKSLGDRNYEKVAQPVRRIRSVYKNTVRKAKYLKFRIKGRTLKRPVRILLTRYGGLGDILLSTPAIRALKKMYPRAFVVFDTSQAGKELLEGNPDIDRITVNSADCIRSSFDWHWHLTYEYFPELHIIDGYLRWIGRNTSVNNNEKKPIIALSESDKKFAKKFIESCGISNNDIVIGLHAQAHYEQRRWPLENFNEVLDYMVRRWNAKIIEFGRDGEPTAGRGLSLVGKCSIKESAAVLQKCTLLVCNDSLMLHVAGSLDVPVVGIFGPAPPTTRLPFNDVSFGCYTKDGCRGCILHQKDLSKFGMSCDKDFPECMNAIKPEEVIENIEIIISKILKNRNIEVESCEHKISKNV